ncbi:MAG: M48 family metalloprotease [Steroidobacteraceae bacterium]
MRAVLRPAAVVLLAAVITLAQLAFASPPDYSTTLDLSPPAAGSDLPDLGSPAEQMLSHTDEYRLGAMVAHELREQNALLEDPEVNEYIQSIGTRLAAQSDMGGIGFHYLVLNDPEINSFAVSGGWVFIFTGLILASSTESELAAVMAHETAHITQHHIARGMQAQSRQSLAAAAAMVAAILLGAIGGGPSGGNVIEGGIVAAQGLAIQSQINFTREEEKEADRVGIGYLAGASFDPNAMATMFDSMSRHEGLVETYIPAMLIDHPVTSDRIAEARTRAQQFPPRRGHDSQSYELIKERVRVLTATGDVDMAEQYAQKVAHGDNSLGTRYGYGLALLQGNHADEATKIFAGLLGQHENLTLLWDALGQAQAKAGHTSEALATFQHAETLFPRNVPLTVRYARALMDAGRPTQAHLMLLDLFNIVPPTPDQIQLTALAASAANDPGDAYYYMGEYQLANGDPQLAVQQYQLALASPHISSIQRQRFQARLDEIRDYLASLHKPKLADEQQDQRPSRHGGGGQ